VCRPAADECDVEETCSGKSAQCPIDKFRAKGHVCRDNAGRCDVQERCTGASAFCPANTFSNRSYACACAAFGKRVAMPCSGLISTCDDACRPFTMQLSFIAFWKNSSAVRLKIREYIRSSFMRLRRTDRISWPEVTDDGDDDDRNNKKTSRGWALQFAIFVPAYVVGVASSHAVAPLTQADVVDIAADFPATINGVEVCVRCVSLADGTPCPALTATATPRAACLNQNALFLAERTGDLADGAAGGNASSTAGLAPAVIALAVSGSAIVMLAIGALVVRRALQASRSAAVSAIQITEDGATKRASDIEMLPNPLTCKARQCNDMVVEDVEGH
jgi:hypothetical protein